MVENSRMDCILLFVRIKNMSYICRVLNYGAIAEIAQW